MAKNTKLRLMLKSLSERWSDKNKLGTSHLDTGVLYTSRGSFALLPIEVADFYVDTVQALGRSKTLPSFILATGG